MRKKEIQRIKALLAHQDRREHQEGKGHKGLEAIPEHREVTHPLDLLREALEDGELEKLGWVIVKLIRMPQTAR